MPCGICGEFCGGYVPLCDKCEKGNKMTTLKEYKAMMEGATDALSYKEASLHTAKQYNKMIIDNFGLFCNSPLAPKLQAEESLKQIEKEEDFLLELKTSRKLIPDLIRVIELAEELLNDISDCPSFVDQATVPKNGVDANPQQVVLNMSISLIKYRAIDEALSEIRKLKGE